MPFRSRLSRSPFVAVAILLLAGSIASAVACSSSNDDSSPAVTPPLDGAADVDATNADAADPNDPLDHCFVPTSDGGQVVLAAGQSECIEGNDYLCPPTVMIPNGTSQYGARLLPGCVDASATRFSCPGTTNTTTPGYETCDLTTDVCASHVEADGGVTASCLTVPPACEDAGNPTLDCQCLTAAANANANADAGACASWVCVSFPNSAYPEESNPRLECDDRDGGT